MKRIAPQFLAVALVFAATLASAATDHWTYTPPASGTRGTISWTDSSGFENIISGIVLENGAIRIYPNSNTSSPIRNADFSIPVEAEDGTPLAYSPDFLAGKDNTESRILGYNTEITNVVVNLNATSIGNYCFKNCTALVRVRLPDGIVSIGSEAFNGCSALVEIANAFPDSLGSIGNNAFQNCKALKGPLVANGLRTIGSRAFHTCSALLGVDLSASTVETFPEYVFFNASKLGSIAFPDTTAAIGNGCFEGCSSLTNVTPLLPPRLETLGTDAKPSLINDPIQGHVVSPPTLERIGTRAFRAAKIETFTAAKKGLKTIGQYAFFQAPNLTNVVLSATMEGITANWLDSSGTAGVPQHVWFRNLPASLPSGLWANTKRLNITIHLPWSQQEAWRAWVASGPSGHTFTFNGETKTLPEKIDDVGTWLSGVTQNVTWWKDRDPYFIIVVR